MNWGTQNKMPVWEGVAFIVSTGGLAIRMPGEAGMYMLEWYVDSPRMQRKGDVYQLESEGDMVRLVHRQADTE
jgi:hypothetical protein